MPVMRWFNKWLKKDETPVPNYAEKLFTGQQLKVFEKLPADEITSKCYENFTQLAVDSHAHDRGIRTTQRARRPYSGVDRWFRRRMTLPPYTSAHVCPVPGGGSWVTQRRYG